MNSSSYRGLPAQEQPQQVYDGLEVDVRPYASGLHTVPRPEEAPQLAFGSDAKDGPYDDGLNPVSPGTDKKNRRIRPLWIALGLVAVLAVIGAVVGGVVGSRAAQSSDSSSSTSGPNSDDGHDETAAVLKNIQPLSRLAATGWRDGTAFHLRLYYQGPDQQLRFSNFTSTGRAWARPVLLNGLSSKPTNNTPLAASVTMEKPRNPQSKVFYLETATNLIRNQVFNHLDVHAQGGRGRFNDFKIEAAPASRLGAYWPFLLSQNRDGSLQLWRYWGESIDHLFFEDHNMTLKASNAAGLAVVPAEASSVEASALLYRRNDGRLYNYITNQDGKPKEGTSWANGNLARISIPAASAIGAFTVARSSSANDSIVNTYILYQGNEGALQMVWQDDDADWKGPETYEAFLGADKGTDIACITAAAWDSSGVSIGPATDLSRCFFQVKGRVREVHWTGDSWESLDFLPID